MNILRKIKGMFGADDTPKQNLLEALRRRGGYTIFLATLQDTGNDVLLTGPGPFTVFAPTDAAFERMPRLAKLLHDRHTLRLVLRRHICPGLIESSTLRGITVLHPLEGADIETAAHSITVQDAHIVDPDLRARNGVAHGIDHLLLRKNHAWLRECGEFMEEEIRAGMHQACEWIKLGALKAENAIDGALKH